MEHNYKKWRQTDPRFNLSEAWPEQQFPDAEYRYFRDCGCLVCSLAVMLCHYGIEKTSDENIFSPLILNQRLIDHGAFSPAADLELTDIKKLYPLEYLGAVPYSPNTLADVAENGLPCLITVPGINSDKHFTALYHVISGDAAVYDPLCGEKKLSSYNRIYEIRVFQKTENL